MSNFSFVPVMYKSDAMAEKAKLLWRNVKRRVRRQSYQDVTEITPLFIRELAVDDERKTSAELSEPHVKLDEAADDDCATNPWKIPASFNVLLFLFRWPITFTLWCTVPDSRRFKRFYLLTFLSCVLWIGCVSYFVIFMSTDVGKKI